MDKSIKMVALSNGCFWCTEAVFSMLKGVKSVISGYTGGNVVNPSYEQVSNGNTGHAESLKIEYDSSVISFDDLLTVFFFTHDPTTLNRQGNDIGTQYRSAIFCTEDEQIVMSKKFIDNLNKSKAYERLVVTEVDKLGVFYSAENYHKEYYEHHKDQPYCQLVITPKIEKLQERFADLLKA